MLIEKMRYTEELGGYLEKIVKEISDRKDVYTKEQKEFFATIINLILKPKLDEEERKRLTNKLREGDGQMLAVIEMLEEENRRLLRQGRKEGRKLGASERNTEIVKNMLKENASIDFILRVTGLTKEKVERIRKEM